MNDSSFWHVRFRIKRVLHHDYRTVNVKGTIPKITGNRTIGEISNPGTLSVLRIHVVQGPRDTTNFFELRQTTGL